MIASEMEMSMTSPHSDIAPDSVERPSMTVMPTIDVVLSVRSVTVIFL